MTFAQFVGSGTTGIIGAINTAVVPAIFAFAFAAFVWGVMRYFFVNGGEEAKRAEGRQFVLWGILAMAVLLSVWGLVNMLLSTLGIAPSGAP
ncbi:hypothetical protein A3I46_02255 [Candidatus Kaiserbacteria bacterium RIFCSPLOWO2_02_FULL_54_13]|uniref:Uncharacterized protein n=1 Tax=Candidatus Kaiserbacteria bacterium RIFCSPHIGHO2_02_FULL_54_22 TaxID=1798495 RepID=A0A1F6DLU0_9BACT|nr:MAG: hypothetical protein UY91_C0010G0008 [Parcubacteria group bacterium GW2011_GWB1_55_9]OGG62398.1 MAG: hypothetical protein A3C19_00450 [Candidatus Kaiserbacteria bacterium RIFCSPHIGHO2_02_FULL_54_22]OGG68078.1 MAG: hypothetical protein A3E99_02300 [Candidatus Kaiserbacteria bacterium RIFCSPHIGHO2_12_FULL_54_16]OGG82453.1 MAG: hypothetical protein A3I46_02255 [Candidatus Kaiserbacteria bacterium RIFCSPLOWO2_02_FULL_54_13]OGG90783.1 MAG: hypothetical protein A3G12_02985 [Candidatus Kaiserb